MNEKEIWDFLMARTGNEYGTAAIMGNLMAESSLNPNCVTGTKDPDYVKKADLGEIDFAHDKHAFGLVQWCYYTRKGGLLSLSKIRGVSVGDLYLQLEYLVAEMSQDYKSVWNAVTGAKDIRTASDVVMLKYEKPATTTEAMKKRRADYGQKYFDTYAKAAPEPAPSRKKMVRAKVNVNLRAAAGLKETRVGSLSKGYRLEYLATENGWHKVAVWVSGDFVEVEGS